MDLTLAIQYVFFMDFKVERESIMDWIEIETSSDFWQRQETSKATNILSISTSLSNIKCENEIS